MIHQKLVRWTRKPWKKRRQKRRRKRRSCTGDASSILSKHTSNLLELRNCIAERKLEKISFNNLWHLFSPGDIVLGQEPFGQHLPQAYQVFSVTKGRHKLKEPGRASDSSGSNPGGRNSLKLQCFYLAYDGSTIGPREETVCVKPYLGEKKITELDFYSKDCYYTGSNSFVQSLLKRGKKFIKSRYGHGTYDGVTTRYGLEHVEGEVFVDFKSGYEDRPEWKKEIGRFRNIKPPQCSSEETYEPACLVKACESCSTAIYSDEQIDIKRCEAFKKSNPLEKVEIDSLKDDHLILLSHHLLAYGLRSKQWRKFRLRQVQETELRTTYCRLH